MQALYGREKPFIVVHGMRPRTVDQPSEKLSQHGTRLRPSRKSQTDKSISVGKRLQVATAVWHRRCRYNQVVSRPIGRHQTLAEYDIYSCSSPTSFLFWT